MFEFIQPTTGRRQPPTCCQHTHPGRQHARQRQSVGPGRLGSEPELEDALGLHWVIAMHADQSEGQVGRGYLFEGVPAARVGQGHGSRATLVCLAQSAGASSTQAQMAQRIDPRQLNPCRIADCQCLGQRSLGFPLGSLRALAASKTRQGARSEIRDDWLCCVRHDLVVHSQTLPATP